MENEVFDLITSMESYLDNLIYASDDIATNFRAGNESQGAIQLVKYIEGLMWLVEAVDALKSANINDIEDEKTSELRSILSVMEHAMADKDYVLLADILEYEIGESLRVLQQRCHTKLVS